jgi:hypothetical protein
MISPQDANPLAPPHRHVLAAGLRAVKVGQKGTDGREKLGVARYEEPLDPVGADEFGTAGCGEQQVGAPRHRGQIQRLRMRHGHRRALRDEKLGERLVDDARAADHQRIEAGEGRMHSLR